MTCFDTHTPKDAPEKAAIGSSDSLPEARFRRIEQNLPCVIYEYESDETGLGKFVYFTPQWLELSEIAVDLAIADVNVVLGIIHPDDLGEFLSRNEYAARTRTVLRIECRIVTPSGKLKWVALTSSPQSIDAQGLILWNGVMMDVSHEKAIEEALQASKDRFEQMAATVPSGLYEYVIHADGTSEYLYLSSRAEEIYEVNPGELQNDINLLWDMVHPDDIEFLRGTDIDCNRRGELFTCEFRILTRSGKLKWLKLASLPNPASPGQPVIWSGYVIDITDQKLIENKIKANEATLRQILDHSPVAIASASLDANPRITYLNQTFIGTFGYTLADIPTVERWGQLAYPDPEYRKRTFDWWNDAVERGRNNDGSVETGEFRVVRKDNAILDVLIGATLVDDAMIVTLIDITERKKAESHLAIAREELTRQKIESSILQERQRLIEDLHDGFGSQLTSARLKVDEGLMDQADLSEILRECLSDLHLVVDTVNSPQITLNEAIRSLRERYQRRLSGRAPQLHWDLELEGILPLPHREALTLLRIIQEALNNALKHAQASKIRIEAIYEPGGELAISIQDDGIGLPAQLAYGKGLHNMRSRAESLGGALTIGNDRPTGTRVALRLTLKTDSETEGR